MPKAIGAPITITAGQQQREVININVNVTWDAAGVPHFDLTAIGEIRIRDAQGNIIWHDPSAVQIAAVPDAQIPAGVRTGLTSLCAKLDTL
jgi:hypothetical protein